MTEFNHLQTCLTQATVSQEVFNLRPDYRVLLLAISGINPGPSDSQSEALLREAESTAASLLQNANLTDLPHISAWRTAYKSFGSKPAKFKNSVEALTKRAQTGLPRVNRSTDIYNAISVKHQIPIGGEDLDKYVGAPKCIRATGDEKFETVAGGEAVVEYPDKGEVVWADSESVTCRRWNWRQCSRTGLREETRRALFILDALGPCTDEALEAAGEELVEALKVSSPELVVARRIIGKSSS